MKLVPLGLFRSIKVVLVRDWQTQKIDFVRHCLSYCQLYSAIDWNYWWLNNLIYICLLSLSGYFNPCNLIRANQLLKPYSPPLSTTRCRALLLAELWKTSEFPQFLTYFRSRRISWNIAIFIPLSAIAHMVCGEIFCHHHDSCIQKQARLVIPNYMLLHSEHEFTFGFRGLAHLR